MVQLQILNNELKVANRIKEGAENMLQMPLTVSYVTDHSNPHFIPFAQDALRVQVESELENAKSQITALTKTIETRKPLDFARCACLKFCQIHQEGIVRRAMSLQMAS